MALNFSTEWAKLSPGKKRILWCSGIVAIVLSIIALVQQEPTKESKYIAKRDQVSSVFTTANTRNQGLDNITGDIRNLKQQDTNIEQRIVSLENQDVKKEVNKVRKQFQEKFNEQQAVITQLRDSIAQLEKKGLIEKTEKTMEIGSRPGKRLSDDHMRTGRVTGKSERTEEQKTSQDALEKAPPEIRYGKESVFEVTPPKEVKRTAKPLKLSVMVERDVSSEEPRAKNHRQQKESVAYIPAGSILTGTIITGGEFPTNKNAFDNPTPLLIRLSKEAILPNRYRSDVRECFLLAGGAGDLASERAKIRGETLSCVRNDGSVIETKLESYVAGEDGKAGVKGRLVSKQGQLIARSLLAGFAGGMSEAFDVDPVPVLATTSTGETQYQDAFSANAVKGAAVKGFSNSLERIAEFYMSMAEDIFPVVEVNAGRQVDIITISGTHLKISAKNALPK